MSLQDELEKWLHEMVGAGGVCFPEKFKVYAPTCYGKCEDAVMRLVHKINQIFGGSTTYKEVEGCWYDEEKGVTECEPVAVIEVGHHCTDYDQARKFIEAIAEYAIEADQKAISISQNSFFIIPSEEFEKRMEQIREKLERERLPPSPAKD